MAACLPASVVIGSAANTPVRIDTVNSMPSTLGRAATAWNVSFGENRMPTKRAGRLFGAGVKPATGAVVVIDVGWKRPIVPRTYTRGWDEMFPERQPELLCDLILSRTGGSGQR